MKHVYTLRSKDREFMAFAEYNINGKDALKYLRESVAAFKRQHIRAVIQAYPSTFPCGWVFRIADDGSVTKTLKFQ